MRKADKHSIGEVIDKTITNVIWQGSRLTYFCALVFQKKTKQHRMVSITKIFSFEAAHAISDYDGACKHLHGHSYILHVRISSEELRQDMILDFKHLKQIVQTEVLAHTDHALMLKDHAENRSSYAHYTGKLLWLPYEPTAERLIGWVAERVSAALPAGITLRSLRLYETATAFVEWEA